MAYRTGQVNFSRGELAPQLYGRWDVDSYGSALKQARNVVVLKYGGVTKRPGTHFVAEVYDASQPTRLLPFQFSLTQTYALEMGQGYMRVAANGGIVIEQELEITNITNAAHAQITAAFHGYEAGNQVWLTGIDGELGDFLNNRFWTVVSSIDDNNFTIDADTSGLLPFAGANGGDTRTQTPAPPPPPPPVPPPSPPPPPPPTGGGGTWCVADDTPILLADGTETQARFLKVGTLVRTQRKNGRGKWGNFRVTALEPAWQPVYRVEIGGRILRATKGHRIWIDDRWQTVDALGKPDGETWIVQISVGEAETYVSNGILSHNLKQQASI